jgi:hypothetical protein
VVYFVDRSLGRKKVPEALRRAGATVEVHDDHFPQSTPDQTWLKEVGRRGWIVLTADKRIRYRSLEREALLAAGVQAFVLTSIPGPEMGDIFAAALGRMEAMCASHGSRPFIAKVSRGPDVKIIVAG